MRETTCILDLTESLNDSKSQLNRLNESSPSSFQSMKFELHIHFRRWNWITIPRFPDMTIKFDVEKKI